MQSRIKDILALPSVPGVSPEDLERFKNDFRTMAYTCRFSACPRATFGFPDEKTQAEHEMRHTQRIICNIAGCHYPPFGSARALRDHVSKCHQPQTTTRKKIRRESRESLSQGAMVQRRSGLDSSKCPNPLLASRPAASSLESPRLNLHSTPPSAGINVGEPPAPHKKDTSLSIILAEIEGLSKLIESNPSNPPAENNTGAAVDIWICQLSARIVDRIPVALDMLLSQYGYDMYNRLWWFKNADSDAWERLNRVPHSLAVPLSRKIMADLAPQYVQRLESLNMDCLSIIYQYGSLIERDNQRSVDQEAVSIQSPTRVSYNPQATVGSTRELEDTPSKNPSIVESLPPLHEPTRPTFVPLPLPLREPAHPPPGTLPQMLPSISNIVEGYNGKSGGDASGTGDDLVDCTRPPTVGDWVSPSNEMRSLPTDPVLFSERGQGSGGKQETSASIASLTSLARLNRKIQI